MLLSLGFSLSAQGASEPVRSITHLTGDVYRFQNDAHFSVFMVTPDGVIATDPVSPDAAEWLNSQIQQRFNQPVKYVIYSHDHWGSYDAWQQLNVEGMVQYLNSQYSSRQFISAF